MKINVYPIVSPLHDKNYLSFQTLNLLDEIKTVLDSDINIVELDKLYNADLSLILIQSGGTETEFLRLEGKFKEPFYFLAYDSNNSLAAAMEILSYLKNKNKEAEIFYGSGDYIASRIKKIASSKGEEQLVKLGVVGEPSDWLISSRVDYQAVKRKFNIELVDISLDEVYKGYKKADLIDFKSGYELKDYDEYDLDCSKKIKVSLDKIINKYELKGLTIRCFDIVKKLETTACLALSLLNSENIISACEGDIPSLISMYILKRVTGQSSFMANPCSVDIKKSEIVLAHCTIPLDMTKSYSLDSHFESGKGVAIKGELEKKQVTIFKLSSNLRDYFLTRGEIVDNLNHNDLCRTQVKVHVDSNISYFLKKPYGNHHLIIYGDFYNEIKTYMEKIQYITY